MVALPCSLTVVSWASLPDRWTVATVSNLYVYCWPGVRFNLDGLVGFGQPLLQTPGKIVHFLRYFKFLNYRRINVKSI